MNWKSNMSNSRKVAIYCRVARLDEEEIKKQEAELRVYAESKGLKNVTLYSDNGYGGVDFNRPAFSEMERDIEAERINMIICRDLSRISRNYSNNADWFDKIKRKGVSFYGIRDYTASS